ncbi:MAG: hypothetical protein Q8Q60_00670 [Candidatus Chromulinivorax sp.]|nr:hypothetical protein [Candidatus Chromulinivorax sp.]
MKKLIKLMLTFVFMMPLIITAIEKPTQQKLAAQIVLLKHMLNECNGQYIHNTTPMYQQDLTFQWYLSYFIPFKLSQMSSCYNAELLLTESKNLSDVIVAMEKLQSIETNDIQIKYLIDMLLRSNNTYLQNTPMNQQSLTLHWWLSYFYVTKVVQGAHFYNAEILLSESKKLADLTYNMSQFQKN